MSDKLFSVAYFSRSTIQGSPAQVEAEVAKILTVARRNNQAARVTGALLFAENCFAQVLEGPQDRVEEIFELIQNDPRHQQVQVIHLHRISERSFPMWSMAFAGSDEELRRSVVTVNVLASSDDIAASDVGRHFLTVLRDFIERNDVPFYSELPRRRAG